MRWAVAFLLSLALHTALVIVILSYHYPEPESHKEVSMSITYFEMEERKLPQSEKKPKREIKKASKEAIKKTKPARKRSEKKTSGTPAPSKAKTEARKVERDSPSGESAEVQPRVPVQASHQSYYPVGIGEEEEEEEDYEDYDLYEYEGDEPYAEEFLTENLDIIRQIIRAHLRYPPIARKMGWEGTVVVKFLLNQRGEISGLEIQKSSGYDILDRSALKVIEEVSEKFPRPEAEVVVVVPIKYHLE